MIKQRGITVIELLVVLAIIGLLASVILVSTRGTKEKAKIVKTLEFSQSILHGLGAEAVGIWSFDDTGNLGSDSSGYGNDGGVVGNTTSTSDTPHDIAGQGSGRYAASFDGAFTNSSCIDIPDNQILNFGTSDFTIEGWIKFEQLTSNGCAIFGNYPHGGQNGDLVVQTWNESIVLSHRNTNGDSGWLVSLNVRPYLDKWTHFAFVKTGSRNAALYVNGKLEAENTVGFDINVDFNGAYYIGGCDWCDAGAGALPVLVDEHRIYCQALTEGQIQKHYVEGLKRFKLAEKYQKYGY